jgi:hypothetical protein
MVFSQTIAPTPYYPPRPPCSKLQGRTANTRFPRDPRGKLFKRPERQALLLPPYDYALLPVTQTWLKPSRNTETRRTYTPLSYDRRFPPLRYRRRYRIIIEKRLSLHECSRQQRKMPSWRRGRSSSLSEKRLLATHHAMTNTVLRCLTRPYTL